MTNKGFTGLPSFFKQLSKLTTSKTLLIELGLFMAKFCQNYIYGAVTMALKKVCNMTCEALLGYSLKIKLSAKDFKAIS